MGIFFDFFDGFFARKFGVSGPLGVQLDSLADMVTSGLVPGFTVFKMLQNTIETSNSNFEYLPYIAFVITLGACFRLANFNIDDRQTDSFIGLPTPANTIFVMGIAVSNCLSFLEPNNFLITLIFISFLSAYVMNAEIPLFALKFKNFTIKKYLLQIVFLITSIIVIVVLKYTAIPLIIILYVVLSICNNLFSKK